jgi:hypothetical protein
MEGVNELDHLVLVVQEEIDVIVNKKVGSKDNKKD